MKRPKLDSRTCATTKSNAPTPIYEWLDITATASGGTLVDQLGIQCKK